MPINSFWVNLARITKDLNTLVAEPFRKLYYFLLMTGKQSLLLNLPQKCLLKRNAEFCIMPLFFFSLMACSVTVVWPHLWSYTAHFSVVLKENLTVNNSNSVCERYAGFFISFCKAKQT